MVEFSIGFKRRLFPFSSPTKTKPSLFISSTRFLLRKTMEQLSFGLYILMNNVHRKGDAFLDRHFLGINSV